MEFIILFISGCTVIAMSIIAAVLLCFLTKNPGGRTAERSAACSADLPPEFYITGDKHRDFTAVKEFCWERQTRRQDVLIILGDSGFNYYEDERDDRLKAEIAALDITLFCLHGNKEQRPQNTGTYGIRNFCGGKVYYEPRFPNILFAMDGGKYVFEGRKYVVVGGAHSVDKLRCLEEGRPFWEDEMPDQSVRRAVEEQLAGEQYQVYGMLSHTCPLPYLPVEMFLSTRESAARKRKRWCFRQKKLFQPDIDRSTEEWLGDLEKKLTYTVWFCGHYHIDKEIDRVCMLYGNIRPLHPRTRSDTA